MDRLSSAERSRLMARIHSKDTEPEIAVRKTVYGLGYRYRLRVQSLPGKPDLVFPNRRKVIFVNGCFWHGHECRVGRYGSSPKSRLEYWRSKIDATRDRDQQELRLLGEQGWTCLVIWECELVDMDSVKRRIVEFLEN